MKKNFLTTVLLLLISCGLARAAAPEEMWVPPPPGGSQLPEMISVRAPSVESENVSLTPSGPLAPDASPAVNTELQPYLIAEPLSQSGWFVRGETLFLHLSHSSNQPLAYYSQNTNVLPIRDFSMFRSGTAFIQELGLNGGCQLTPSCTIRAGYNLFVISGLARAGDQLDFSPSPFSSLSTNGTVVLHGPSAGIEFRF